MESNIKLTTFAPSINQGEDRPSYEDYKFLRESVNWSLDKIGMVRATSSLMRSPLIISAWDTDNPYSGDDLLDCSIVGMVRLSGDLEMYANIQDTIVIPNYQRKGIGKAMMNLLIDQVKDLEGYLLGVCPSKDSVKFYRNFGFINRPENPNGYMYIDFGKTIPLSGRNTNNG